MDFSFQLYSARNFQPWSDVLAMLAAAGYKNVEGFGGVYEDPSASRKLMDQNGLSMPSGHFSIDALEGDLDGVLKTASTLGIKQIYCPLPVMLIKASTQDKGEGRDIYACPVYKTLQRGPTYVFVAGLRTKASPAKWVMAGVAMLMDIES